MQFSPEEREKALSNLVDYIKAQKNIEGIILVGSGAVGFSDKYSDIDLSVVVSPAEMTKKVWNLLSDYVLHKYDVLRHGFSEYAENNYLTIFLHKNFLQVDLGVISLENLVAKRKRWKVLFDRDGHVAEKMKKTWKERALEDPVELAHESLDGIWYFIQNAVIALNRSRPLRVSNEITEIRNEALKLLGSLSDIDVKHFRDVDDVSEEIKERLIRTYPASFDRDEQLRALREVVDLYFDLIEKLDSDNEKNKEFGAIMREYVNNE